MSGYYTIKASANGKWVFNLKAGNHEVILSSQTYATKQSALEGIASVQANGGKAESFEKKVSSAKEPYFVLLASNKQVIGKSEMYTTEAGRDNGIASVMKNAAATKIVEAEAAAG